MAFALSRFVAYGVEVDEVVTKRFFQRAAYSITGLATDTTLDISNATGTFWTAVGGTVQGAAALSATFDIANRAKCLVLAGGSELLPKSLAGAEVEKMSSTAGAGGAATAVMTVTGLLTTDIIVAVTQRVKGANNLPLLGWNTQAANAITAVWSADPGAGSIIDVSVIRENGAPQSGEYVMGITNNLPSITFATANAPTSGVLVLEWEILNQQLPVSLDTP